jgi:hypothetical protein
MNSFKRLFVIALCFSFIFTAGCGNTFKKIGRATEGAMYMVVLIPIAIISSPIALVKIIKDNNNSNIVKSQDGKSLEMKKGESKIFVFMLLGKPNSKYICTNPKYEIWEYDKIEKDRYTYMVFNESDKIEFFSNTWIVSDTCKTLNM